MSKKYTDKAELQSDSSCTFQFVKLKDGDKRLFCFQQSAFLLAWVLYFKQDVLPPVEWVTQKYPSRLSWLKVLRRHAGFFKKQAKLLLVFTLYKYQWRNGEWVVTLPKYGQVSVPVHQGYKIFDFRRRVVIKVFDNDVPLSCMQREIETIKKSAESEVAPNLYKWNLNEKWYEEDFFEGRLESSFPTPESGKFLADFKAKILPLMGKVVFAHPPTYSSHVGKYFEDMVNHTELIVEDHGKEIKSKRSDALKRFFEQIQERLRLHRECGMYLLFSHGDFVPANIINTGEGVKLIDWEHAGSRSALYDFYSYCFNRTVSRKLPVEVVVEEVKKALPMFWNYFVKTMPEVVDSTRQLEDVYRWIFYAEMLCKLMLRETSDRNLDINRYLSLYMQAFSEFENQKCQSTLPHQGTLAEIATSCTIVRH